MPSPLVDKSHGVFRDWFRKVWEVRGGGLYAVGFAATFLVLEVRSLGEDLSGIGRMFSDGVISSAAALIIELLVDSFTNTFRALIWPVFVVQWSPPWGIIGLGLAYFGFASFLKKPITDWLFDGEPG